MVDNPGVRIAALNRLAVATRERLPENAQDRDAFFRVYLDDTGIFETAVFVAACRRLEQQSQWFPKKAEIIASCRQVMAARRLAKDEQQHTARRQLLAAMPTVDPEAVQSFRARVTAALHARRFSFDRPKE